MVEEPRNGSNGRDDAQRLRDLEDRLTRLTKQPDARVPMADYDKAHIAWRMVTEIVAGILMGCGVGYGLDYLLGTKPFLMILFIFIGFAAGIKVMMRTAAELGSSTGPAPGTDKRD